ncbi:MAG: hypothetical protein ACKVS8_05325 [Phycisphaerales bacterium]
MRISRSCVPVAAAASLSLCAAAHAGFTLNGVQASAFASSSLFGVGGDPTNMAGSNFGAFVLLNAGFDGSVFVNDSNLTNASTSVQASIDEGPGTITGSGGVAADVDADDASAGFAAATSSINIVFSISEPMMWTMDASATGVHADASVSLTSGMTTLFTTTDPDSPITGLIGPGFYTLAAGASASSDLSFFSGLFADASYNFTFQLAPIPSPSAALAMGSMVLLAARRRR